MDSSFTIKQEEEVDYFLISDIQTTGETVCDEYSNKLLERISDIKQEPDENYINTVNEFQPDVGHDTGGETGQMNDNHKISELNQNGKRRAKTASIATRKRNLEAKVAKSGTFQEFLRIGNIYTKTGTKRNPTVKLRQFKSFFGVTPQLCAIIWAKMEGKLPESHPKHLLWCLNFLKHYSNERTRRLLFKTDEKTVRKWTWMCINMLSNLNVINWNNRFDGAVKGQTCFCSLDGVDFRITDPKCSKIRWYSHKFRAAALRYEIGLNITTGYIVWKHGGYPCGEFSDLKVAQEAYVPSVGDGELTMADKDYKDEKYFLLPNETNKQRHTLIMSRHDIINRRLRYFQALKKSFRHDLEKHPQVFNAIVNLIQISIENGDPLF